MPANGARYSTAIVSGAMALAWYHTTSSPAPRPSGGRVLTSIRDATNRTENRIPASPAERGAERSKRRICARGRTVS